MLLAGGVHRHHLGRPDLVALCLKDDCVAQDPVKAFLGDAFKTETQAQWIDVLSKLDVGWAPVLDMAEAITQPQAKAREMVLEDDQGHQHIGNPIKLTEEPAKFGFASPALNQHADELLVSLGYDARKVAAMKSAGVFG